jgi:hypothetical protein
MGGRKRTKLPHLWLQRLKNDSRMVAMYSLPTVAKHCPRDSFLLSDLAPFYDVDIEIRLASGHRTIN